MLGSGSVFREVGCLSDHRNVMADGATGSCGIRSRLEVHPSIVAAAGAPFGVVIRGAHEPILDDIRVILLPVP